MLARKKSSQNGKIIPLDWSEGAARLLNDGFKAECTQKGRYFDVYGQFFSEEILVIVSYLSEKDEYLAPITLFLSCEPDQMATPEKVKETQKNFIDLIGLFFDEIIADESWDGFEPNWQEVSHKNENYFYKITRENINASLEADKLLGEDFEDVEYELDDEVDLVEDDDDDTVH
jgi:hypothetical protein